MIILLTIITLLPHPECSISFLTSLQKALGNATWFKVMCATSARSFWDQDMGTHGLFSFNHHVDYVFDRGWLISLDAGMNMKWSSCSRHTMWVSDKDSLIESILTFELQCLSLSFSKNPSKSGYPESPILRVMLTISLGSSKSIPQVMSGHPGLLSVRILLGQFSQTHPYSWCFFLVIFHPLIPTLLLSCNLPFVHAVFAVDSPISERLYWNGP